MGVESGVRHWVHDGRQSGGAFGMRTMDSAIQALLDENAPVFDARRADTAIFYSISNTQTGLRGVSFGSFLLKRVIDDLHRDFPKLRHFDTLSPLPGLAAWVRKNPQELAAQGLEFDAVELATGGWTADAAVAAGVGPSPPKFCKALDFNVFFRQSPATGWSGRPA